MTKYYGGSCEMCHAIFANLSRWQVIRMWFRHKHLLDAVLHSNAGFYLQEEFINIKEIFE